MNTTIGQDVSTTEATALSRDQWSSHPRFPSQALLLGSHENFRRVSGYLIEEAAGEASARAIGGLYRRWISAMRSHEAYEESKLYPFLERRWHTSLEAAERGHHELHTAHDAVISALDAAVSSEEGRADDALHLALVRHDEVLREHLALEEDMVIPLLLALSSEEFVEYYDQPLWVLLERLDQKAENGER